MSGTEATDASDQELSGSVPLLPGPAPLALPPLPAPLSSFVGREREVDGVVELLRAGRRLVTLVGPGGVGKTRLALAVAEAVTERSPDLFPDGVGFVALDALFESELVGWTVLRAFGFAEERGRTPVETLGDLLRRRRLLLILDNFEHLLRPDAPEAVLFVADLLATCRGLVVLATSRAPLDLGGEQLYPVEPFPVPRLAAGAAGPSPAAEEEVAALAASAAGRLFLDRARGRDPGFELTAENARAVAEICRRADGLPLGIELAAGRLRALSPEALATLLARRLTVLEGGPRDAQPRQRSVESTLAWSYELLPAGQQTLLRRLGVFVGGFTPAAAAAMVDVDEAAVLGDLLELAGQSLVRPEHGPLDEPRFGLLETTREFALERLAAAGEEPAVRQRHAAFFHRLAEEGYFGLRGAEQDVWLRRLDAELPNIRAALTFSSGIGSTEIELGLARALGGFLGRRGLHREARRWLDQSLAESQDASPFLRASALLNLGNICVDLADLPSARLAYEESLALWRSLGEIGGVAGALLNLGIIAEHQGDHQRAKELIEEADPLWSQLGSAWHRALAQYHLGLAMFGRGDLSDAHQVLTKSLGLFTQVGDQTNAANVYQVLGRIAQAEGRYEEAGQAFQQTLSISRELSHGLQSGVALIDLARLAREQGAFADALEHYRAALSLRAAVADRLGMVEGIEGIAIIAALSGNLDDAAPLLAASVAWREKLGTPPQVEEVQLVETAGARARRALGEAAWTALQTLASRTALNELAEVALSLKLQAASPIIREAGKAPTPAGLTPREVEVVRLLAQGLTDQEIADILSISLRTAQTHVGRILGKLDARSRTEAALYAVRHGLG